MTRQGPFHWQPRPVTLPVVPHSSSSTFLRPIIQLSFSSNIISVVHSKPSNSMSPALITFDIGSMPMTSYYVEGCPAYIKPNNAYIKLVKLVNKASRKAVIFSKWLTCWFFWKCLEIFYLFEFLNFFRNF